MATTQKPRPPPKAAVTVLDVPGPQFVASYAKFLKRSGKIELPRWVDYVKTGIHKELAPYDPDWYYIRAASIARKVYINGGRGVGSLRKAYGGSMRRGAIPPTFVPASGSIIRHIFHQLEKLKVLEKHPKGGRRISRIGRRDLDRIAGRVAAANKSLAAEQAAQSQVQVVQPATQTPPTTQK